MIMWDVIDIIVKYILPTLTFIMLVVLPFAHKWAKHDIQKSISYEIEDREREHDKKHSEISERIRNIERDSDRLYSTVDARVISIERENRSMFDKFDHLEKTMNARFDKFQDLLIELFRNGGAR